MKVAIDKKNRTFLCDEESFYHRLGLHSLKGYLDTNKYTNNDCNESEDCDEIAVADPEYKPVWDAPIQRAKIIKRIPPIP